MTTTVAINCSNGIVIGADSQRSIGSIVGYPVNKLFVDAENNTIVATAGSVGLGDKFKKIVQQFPNVKENYKKMTGKEWGLDGWVENISHLMIEELVNSKISLPRDDFSALLGYVEKGVIKCLSFDGNILPSPIEGFFANGSGMIQALPFLKNIMDTYSLNSIPNTVRGILFAYWAIKHSIDASPGHIGYPIRISSILRNHNNEIVTSELTVREIEEICEVFFVELNKRTLNVFDNWEKEFLEWLRSLDSKNFEN